MLTSVSMTIVADIAHLFHNHLFRRYRASQRLPTRMRFAATGRCTPFAAEPIFARAGKRADLPPG